MIKPLVLFSLLSKATVCPQVFQTPSNSPLARGRTGFACLEHDAIWYFLPLQATVCTQVIESSQITGEQPPSPQFWGSKAIQSPPELGDLGGEKDLNEVSSDLCVHCSPLQGWTKGGSDYEGFRYLCVVALASRGLG
jgi:hypothetical protein